MLSSAVEVETRVMHFAPRESSDEEGLVVIILGNKSARNWNLDFSQVFDRLSIVQVHLKRSFFIG